MTDHETREQAISALVEELAARSPWDDSPSGRYEFCHYCANTRVTGTEGQHADDCLWQRAALLTADAALPSSREMQLDAIVRWLLGEEDEFPNPPEKVAGRYFPLYWWRTELRRRVAALPDPNAAHGETPDLCWQFTREDYERKAAWYGRGGTANQYAPQYVDTEVSDMLREAAKHAPSEVKR
jgi:hypothetical protein